MKKSVVFGSNSWNLWTCLKQGSYVAIRKKLLLNNIFYFKHYFIFFNVNEHLAVPFVKFARGRSHVGHLLFFVYTGLSVWAFPQSPRLSLTYCLKSSLLPAFCFLFVWLIKLKCVSHPSHNYKCFRGSCLILRGWRGNLGTLN